MSFYQADDKLYPSLTPLNPLYSMSNIGGIDIKNKWDTEGDGLKVHSLASTLLEIQRPREEPTHSV